MRSFNLLARFSNHSAAKILAMVGIIAPVLAACSSTRTLNANTCEEATVFKSLLDSSELGRIRHPFAKECLSGLVIAAIGQAADAEKSTAKREAALNIAASIVQANPEIGRYAAETIKAKGLKSVGNLSNRPTDIRVAPHPNDSSKVIFYRLEATQ